jgi:hypothetical protein
MNCEEIQNLLVDFEDDLLNPITRYPVEAHLKTCEACNKELDEIRALFQVISKDSLQQPTASLKENFNTMLREEMNKLEEEKLSAKKSSGNVVSMPWIRYAVGTAAALAIFFTGMFFGNKWKTNKETAASPQITELKNEMKDVKEILMLNLLKEESASDRIKGVNYAEEMHNPDQKVLHALINTLNNDKNVNVRLASLYSLAKFTDIQLVRDSLVSSLDKQAEPVIQVMLINLLTEKKESKAIKPIQDIISNAKTLKEVKDIARQGLKSM